MEESAPELIAFWQLIFLSLCLTSLMHLSSLKFQTLDVTEQKAVS